MKKQTWKIVAWADRPDDTSASIPMQCDCGFKADVPCGKLTDAEILGITDHGLIIFDPPGFLPAPNWCPQKIQCPRCKAILGAAVKEVA